jgi:anti-sigma factor RsiW
VKIAGLWKGTCHETGEHLSEHLDGELRGLKRLRVVRHLERCELCQAVLRSLIRTIDGLRALGRAEPAAPSVAPVVVERIRRTP